jgi:hypothetical protein
MLRPKLMVPAAADSWSDERIRIVLGHELAHINRGDWLWHMAAAVTRAACWFNPLIWIACHRLHQESERACDDEVLRMGVGGREYAEHLLEVATAFVRHRQGWPSLLAQPIASPNSLEGRITAMLNTGTNRTPLTTSARAFAALTFLSVAWMVAGLGGQAFATLSGTVADPSGAYLPDTTLTLVHMQSQAKHEVHTDATGRFEFVGLPAGDYRLKAQAAGFADPNDRLLLGSGQTAVRNLVLQVGSLQETITVVDSPASASPRRVGGYERKAPACTPSTGGGRLTPPTKVTDVRPRFPQSLRGSGVPSQVTLEARIGTDGLVTEARVVHLVLDRPDLRERVSADVEDAAVSAVKQWEFTPTLLNCVPIEVSMKVNLTFR